MTVAEIVAIGGIVVTVLATVILPLYRDRNAARDKAIEQAEARALATARSEALIREGTALVEQKNSELAKKDVLIAEKDTALSECSQANSELRQLLLQCTRGNGGRS